MDTIQEMVHELRQEFVGKKDKPTKSDSRKGPRDPERFRQVHDMRFEKKMTLQQIGNHFGVSREAIRQTLRENTQHIQTERTKEKRLEESIKKVIKRNAKNNFWDRVNKDTETGCWEWIGYKTPLGYGKMKGRYAHRISLEMHSGRIPKGLVVMHKCDNPGCVNPDHLEAGTQKENIRDSMNKGRRPKSSKPPVDPNKKIIRRPKPSEKDIERIKYLKDKGEKVKDISSATGYPQARIYRVLKTGK